MKTAHLYFTGAEERDRHGIGFKETDMTLGLIKGHFMNHLYDLLQGQTLSAE